MHTVVSCAYSSKLVCLTFCHFYPRLKYTGKARSLPVRSYTQIELPWKNIRDKRSSLFRGKLYCIDTRSNRLANVTLGLRGTSDEQEKTKEGGAQNFVRKWVLLFCSIDSFDLWLRTEQKKSCVSLTEMFLNVDYTCFFDVTVQMS